MGTADTSAHDIEGGELPRPTPGVPLGRRWAGLAVALVGLPLLTLVLVLGRAGLDLGSVLLL
jgi:hypothetical protein